MSKKTKWLTAMLVVYACGAIILTVAIRQEPDQSRIDAQYAYGKACMGERDSVIDCMGICDTKPRGDVQWCRAGVVDVAMGEQKL